MKMLIKIFVISFCIVYLINLASAAHWIVGYVEDALDSTSPNGRTVRLWNPSNGDEIFSIVGPGGPSGTSNVYMLDCELLTTPCDLADNLSLILVSDGTGHITKEVINITVTTAGVDVAENMSINSPPTFTNITVEDSFTSPENEIDLTPATTITINCEGVVSDYDSDTSMINATAEFYSSTSFYGDTKDNNTNYKNNSCTLNSSYGTSLESYFDCSFEIEYYANADSWDCTVNITDNYTASITSSDSTQINSLISLGVNSSLDFGTVDVEAVSDEELAEVINYGNVKINLSLSGYGQTPGDGNSMNCNGTNISIAYTKYNITETNPGSLDLPTFENTYKNLTSNTVIEELKLNFRQNDITNDAKNNTYWRVYVPKGVYDSCQGNIIFGATQN